MNWEKFNNRLRKDAEEQNNDIDIDSIWGAIEPQVDEINTEKKKKRRAIFFWWGTGVLLLSVGLWFLGNQFLQKENIAEDTDNQEITIGKKSTLEEKNENLKTTIEPTQEVDLGKNDLENKNASPKGNSTTSNFSKNKTPAKTKSSNTKSPQSPVSNAELNNKNSLEINSAIIPATLEYEEVILRGSHSSKDKIKLKEEILEISSLISLLDFSTEKISLSDKEKVWKLSPRENKKRFSIGVYSGANFTHRTLGDKSENGNTLLEIRDKYETPLETSQVGINFSIKIFNKEKYNIEISTGLQLTSIAERYKNYSTTTTDGEIFGVQYLSYGLGTDPVEIMGWVAQTKTTEYKKEIFNTYRMIDIPILIGYNRSFGEKWQVGVQAGIFANLSLKAEGIIPNENLADLVLAPDGDGAIFKTNVGLSYHLGLNFKRKLSEHWELNISPAVRYFGNDFTNENYGLSQKYVLFGGNVGVNYRF